jgi:hypothetical protein
MWANVLTLDGRTFKGSQGEGADELRPPPSAGVRVSAVG